MKSNKTKKLSKKEQANLNAQQKKVTAKLMKSIESYFKEIKQIPGLVTDPSTLLKEITKRRTKIFYNTRNTKFAQENPNALAKISRDLNRDRLRVGLRPLKKTTLVAKIYTKEQVTRRKLQQKLYYEMRQYQKVTKKDSEREFGGVVVNKRKESGIKFVNNLKQKLRQSGKTNQDYQKFINMLRNQESRRLRRKNSYLGENIRANEIARRYEEEINIWFISNSEKANMLTEEFGRSWMTDWSLARVALEVSNTEDVFGEIGRKYNIKSSEIKRAFENYQFHYRRV